MLKKTSIFGKRVTPGRIPVEKAIKNGKVAVKHHKKNKKLQMILLFFVFLLYRSSY